jgi:hypothetical protein
MAYTYKIRQVDLVNGTFHVQYEGLNPINLLIPHDETGFLTGEALDTAIQQAYPWEVEQREKFAKFTNGAEIQALVEPLPPLSTEALAKEIRFTRNSLLIDCDWTQLADSALITEQKTAWSEYRQALRDITTQPGFPSNITWPVAP